MALLLRVAKQHSHSQRPLRCSIGAVSSSQSRLVEFNRTSMLRPGRGGATLPTQSPSSGGYNNGGFSSGSGGYSNGSYGGYSSNNGAAYGGYAGGSAYGGSSSDSKDKPRRKHGTNPLLEKLKEPWVWSTIVAVLLLFSTMRYRSQTNLILRELKLKSPQQVIDTVRQLEQEKKHRDRAVLDHKSNHQTVQSQYTKLEGDYRRIQKERDELRVKYESPERVAEERRLKTREEAWQKQVVLLQQAMAKESKRAAVEKYGPGPHYVKIGVVLPHERAHRTFTLQMASLDLMPHSVFLFLEQVSHGLWNNAWFYLNGPHVLQGGPLADEDYEDDEAERAAAVKPFKELQLDTLSFPEYSPDYPHVPYSVGFAGRPGGPDFYINKMDNTVMHGPGGQFQHDLEEFADPCFAKVVSGMDTLTAIFDMPVITDEEEWEWFYEDPVHIVGAEILKTVKDSSTPDHKYEGEEAETLKKPHRSHAHPNAHKEHSELEQMELNMGHLEGDQDHQMEVLPDEMRETGPTASVVDHGEEQHHQHRRHNPHLEHQVDP